MFELSDKKRKNVLINCDHGLMIVNRFDHNEDLRGHGQWLLDHGNANTVEAAATIRSIKRPDPVIFDIGANIGTYTTLLSKAFPTGKLYSFEPQRLVFQMLCGNLAINNYENCYAYNLALADYNGIIQVFEPDYSCPEDFGLFSLVNDKIRSKSGVSYKLEIKTLDQFVSDFAIEQLDFIKIDAEGMDLQILKGARNTLARFSPSLLVEFDNTENNILDNLVDFLGKENYTFELIQNNILAIPK